MTRHDPRGMAQPQDAPAPGRPPWAPRRASRGVAPLVHRYAILAWSVAIACWFAAGLLAQQLHGPTELTSDSSSFAIMPGPGGLLTVQTHTTTTVLPTSHAALFYGGLSVAWAVLVVCVARGANWARITQTVLGVLGAAAVLGQALASLRGTGVGAVLPGWLDVVALLAIAAAILALYRPAANAYFAGRPPDAPRPVRTPLPLDVRRAVWLLGVAAGLGAVSGIVRAWSPSASAITIGEPVISLAVQVLLILFLLRGATWARTLETVIVALGGLGLPLALTVTVHMTPMIVVTLVFSLAVLVLDVTALVLLYRPGANEFFGTGISVERGQRTP